MTCISRDRFYDILFLEGKVFQPFPLRGGGGSTAVVRHLTRIGSNTTTSRSYTRKVCRLVAWPANWRVGRSHGRSVGQTGGGTVGQSTCRTIDRTAGQTVLINWKATPSRAKKMSIWQAWVTRIT